MMKKVIKLTESDLTRIVKRVIEEHFILNQDYKIILSNSHPIDKTIKCFNKILIHEAFFLIFI